MGSNTESQQAALVRGRVRIKSLTDRQRAESFLTLLRTVGDLDLHYEQTCMSGRRRAGWAISWCMLALCGAVCRRLQSFGRRWMAGDPGLSGATLLARCTEDAGLLLLSAAPWLCSVWCLVCLFSAGSCPMCSHCLWCVPCLCLLPCIYYLWCVCIRKPATLYALYHGGATEGLRLTGGEASLYLRHLTLKVGRSNLLAIIDGVTNADAVRESILKEEPMLGWSCAEVFVFQQAEQAGEGGLRAAETRRLRDYLARYFSAARCAGCRDNS